MVIARSYLSQNAFHRLSRARSLATSSCFAMSSSCATSIPTSQDRGVGAGAGAGGESGWRGREGQSQQWGGERERDPKSVATSESVPRPVSAPGFRSSDDCALDSHGVGERGRRMERGSLGESRHQERTDTATTRDAREGGREGGGWRGHRLSSSDSSDGSPHSQSQVRIQGRSRRACSTSREERGTGYRGRSERERERGGGGGGGKGREPDSIHALSDGGAGQGGAQGKQSSVTSDRVAAPGRQSRDSRMNTGGRESRGRPPWRGGGRGGMAGGRARATSLDRMEARRKPSRERGWSLERPAPTRLSVTSHTVDGFSGFNTLKIRRDGGGGRGEGGRGEGGGGRALKADKNAGCGGGGGMGASYTDTDHEPSERKRINWNVSSERSERRQRERGGDHAFLRRQVRPLFTHPQIHAYTHIHLCIVPHTQNVCMCVCVCVRVRVCVCVCVCVCV
jgi:hypothetical protein